MLTYDEKRNLTDGIYEAVSSDINSTSNKIERLTDTIESKFDKIYDKLDEIADQLTNLCIATGLMDYDENGDLTFIDSDKEELEELYNSIYNKENDNEV